MGIIAFEGASAVYN
ncbi:Protein of unknown function [Bacillus cereus]|nr:Protein of unknown function [Bacillus cereus]